MALSLQVTPKLGYLHIVVTGELTRDNVVAYVERVRVECIERKCPYVVLEDRLAGPRLKLRDVVSLSFYFRKWPMDVTVAYVFHSAGFIAARLAEAISVLRGFHIGAFATVEEAEQWLLKRT